MIPILLIKEITIGKSVESQQHIKPGKITILVGPNNSGKSQFLRDIRDRMIVGKGAQPTIISQIKFENPATYSELVRG